MVYKTKPAGRQPGRRVPGNPAIVPDPGLPQKIIIDNQNSVAYSVIQKREARRFQPPPKTAPLKLRKDIK